jgi:nitroimidazol reductase NimA-like FMN-containing flavoprotein (pyridoxamine 5'-phosphate oxidase superfamily)
MDQMMGQFVPLDGRTRWAFLERARVIRLASALGDGPIYVSPLWFAAQDETIYIPLAGDDRHRDNIEAGARVSGVVDAGGDELTTIHAVSFSGTAERVDDLDLAEELLELIVGKYFYVGHPGVEHFLNIGRTSGRSWYQLNAESTEGFDMRAAPQPAIQERRILPEKLISA